MAKEFRYSGLRPGGKLIATPDSRYLFADVGYPKLVRISIGNKLEMMGSSLNPNPNPNLNLKNVNAAESGVIGFQTTKDSKY